VPEARKPSLFGQTLLVFCGNSGGYVVAIITGIVVARTLGPAGKGVAAYAALVMALFTTFGNGLQTGIMHECGKNGTPQLLAYGAAMRLLGFTMLPAAAALGAMAFLDPRHAAFAYVAIAVPFAVYSQLANAVFLLRGDVRTPVIQNAIPIFAVGLLTVPALTIFHGGLTAVLAIWAASFVAGGCFVMVRLWEYLPPWSLATTWDLVRRQAWFGLRSGTTSLAAFLNLRIDVFVVSIMLDARTLGVYSLAVATGELMWQVSRPLTLASSGRVASAERAHAITLTCTVTRSIVALECLLGVAIFALAPLAVQFVYGAAFAEAGSVVRWLMPGLVLYAAQVPLLYFLSVKEGNATAALAIQAASVVACAAISLLLVPRIGIFGAALATTVTYCCAAAATGALFARSTGSAVTAFTLLGRADLGRLRALLERVTPERGRVRAA
jgi:O-antigen/teichoic acid export membrane protein